jgi:fucose permease
LHKEPNTVTNQKPGAQTSADSRDGSRGAAPAAAQSDGMFTVNGKRVLLTFSLLSSLFLLWGFCNGMIDVMDKHFQEELHLSLSQSAWVQFAHWMGYFLMSMPAGWLATRLGYRGGLVAGLLLVAVGGFWFIPATKIVAFWAFLLGVCVVAAGLTFLETVANPYTTVLGAPRYAAARINLAQSCNGVGLIFGPIVGGLFFYGKDAAGRSTGSETLWIPYAGVGVVVLILAAILFFAPMPDIRAEDDYGIGGKDDNDKKTPAVRQVNRRLSFALLLGNFCALFGVFGMILWLVLGALGAGPHLVRFASALGIAVTADTAVLLTLFAAGCVALAVVATWLAGVTRRLTHHSIWSHEHFSGAVLAQFFYVAAQAGIFSFLINYVTAEPPSLPGSWLKADSTWVETRTAFAGADFKNMPSLASRLTRPADPVSAFLAENLSTSTRETLLHYRNDAASETAARVAVMQDLNTLVLKQSVYRPDRFEGIALSEKTRELLSRNGSGRNEPRLNRLLLADAFPKELSFHDGVVSVTNQFATTLASIGFICFLLGRVVGAGMLRRLSAHKAVGLYAMVNTIACLVVVLKLGWLSVVCVFVSYFFMSIMFPTIFALGIFGLGEKAKGASAYIVMAIVGGALLPKLMGAVADHYDMSRGFIVPLLCFVLISLYGYSWPKLSRAESLHGVSTTGGH